MINYFYDEVGVRHAMLTWNELNALATGWPVDVTRGLTEAGKKAVKRIQDLGMVMDVSHLNDKCFWGVIDLAQGPIIASHSNARSVCPAMRNLTDDMLKAIAKTGGLVRMNSMREFIFAVIGVPASIYLIVTQAPLLLVFCAIIVGMNMIVSFVFGKIFKFNLEEICIASNANIGGPTTAAALAIAKGWQAMVVPALLVGTLGYVIGNYYGIFIGTFLGR